MSGTGASICYDGKRAITTYGTILLYDLETQKLLLKSNTERWIPLENDSMIFLIEPNIVRRISLADGSQIDSMIIDTYFMSSLTSNGDTIALTRNGVTVTVMSWPNGDTISSGEFLHTDGSPNTALWVSRIPSTDSIVVHHSFYQDGRNFHAIAATARCAMNNLGGKQVSDVFFGKLYGRRLAGNASGRDLQLRDRFSMALINGTPSDVVPLPSGEYVVIHYGRWPESNFSITVLSADLDSLWSAVLKDTLPTYYRAWVSDQGKVSIAGDSSLWRIDLSTGSVSRESGIWVEDLDPIWGVLDKPMIITYTAASGKYVYDLENKKRKRPTDFDQRSIQELKPNGHANRFLIGEYVYDVSDAGELSNELWWPHKGAEYSIEEDAWYTILGNSISRVETLDTVVTVVAARHTAPLVDAWLSNDSRTYYTADRNGLVLEWDLKTNQFIAVSRSRGLSLLAIHSERERYSFVQRAKNGKLSLGIHHYGGAEEVFALTDDSVQAGPSKDSIKVSIAGPTIAGTYFVIHPSLPYIMVVGSTGDVARVQTGQLRGLLLDSSANKLYAIDRERLLIFDALSLVRLDTLFPAPGFTLHGIHRAYDNRYVLLQARKKGVDSALSLRTTLYDLVLKDIERMSPVLYSGVPLGDGRTILCSFSSTTLGPIQAWDIVTGDTVLGGQLSPLVPPLANPGVHRFKYQLVGADISSDASAKLIRFQNWEDVVVTKTNSTSTVQYFDWYDYWKSSVVMHERGKYIELRGYDHSTFFRSSDYAPIAYTSDPNVSLFDTPTGAHAISASGKDRIFREPLGSIDTFGNMLQVPDSAVQYNDILGPATFYNDGYSYFFDYDRRTYLHNVKDGSSYTLDVPLGNWTSHLSADSRLLTVATDTAVFIYDLKYSSPVGVVPGFQSVQRVQWSLTGRNLFVAHDNNFLTHYGLDDVPLSVTRLAQMRESSPYRIIADDYSVVVSSTHSDTRDYFVKLFTMLGESLANANSNGNRQCVLRIPVHAAQQLYLSIHDHNSVVTVPISRLR